MKCIGVVVRDEQLRSWGEGNRGSILCTKVESGAVASRAGRIDRNSRSNHMIGWDDASIHNSHKVFREADESDLQYQW